ncbi:hypothetical protein BAE44_0005837 [Dichanthelium oligosanthes]|uniref:Transmembrane protein n=1 Tax=Dichanthelium oligosanthes TaxID=888268 RepID=A0A1E5W6W7_9POAL|nr:hypothetical protein BAE44_0005837 [Dichanthelium oligosanthes]
MAEKMDKLQAPLLPVPVEKNKKQARASTPFPAVLFVSLWGLFNATAVALTFAFVCVLKIINPCVSDQLPSWMLPTVELTDAEDAKGSALAFGFMLCAVLQAAGGTLALLLGGHRRRIRRVLAYVVLAAAVAGHCMYASAVVIVLDADPGYLFVRILCSAAIVVLAIDDLLGFLALLCGGEE